MAELTPAEVLAQLRTRGFEEGFERTPLREFTGKLTTITGNMIDRWTPARLEVLYNFEDVEVIESTTPYPFPVAQIGILHSNRKKSAMGYFGASIDKVVNADVADDAPADQVKGQDYLIGKNLHMKMTGGHMIWDGNASEERPRDCWELLGVLEPGQAVAPTPAATATENVGVPATKAASVIEVALRILEGKTEAQFNQEIFKEPLVKSNPEFQNSIINRTFLPPLEAVGTVTKDDNGVYHVKKEE